MSCLSKQDRNGPGPLHPETPILLDHTFNLPWFYFTLTCFVVEAVGCLILQAYAPEEWLWVMIRIMMLGTALQGSVTVLSYSMGLLKQYFALGYSSHSDMRRHLVWGEWSTSLRFAEDFFPGSWATPFCDTVVEVLQSCEQRST